MTQIKLQNPENQAKFTALFDEFNQKKADLIALDDELKNLESKQAKNAATLTAVRNEFDVEIGKIKAKFDEQSELTLDDYSETQKLKAELKSRVDFFNAVGEELESKIYFKREEVYRAKTALFEFRKTLYQFTALCLMDEFIEQNKAKIALFKGLFVQSVDYDPLTGKSGHDVFNELLPRKFNLEPRTPEEMKMPALTLAFDWKPKTLTQKHFESYQPQKESGFKRLLTEI